MSKVLLITGASRGIGRACVIRALEHTNARVFAIARSKDALEELAQQYKDRMAYLDDDLTKEDVCTEAIQQCIAKFDRLDAIICSAGSIEPIAKIADSNVDAWKKLFDVNFFSILELNRAALPYLRSTKGATVMINSGASDRAYHGWGAYCTSKAALKMLAMNLSVEEPDITAISLHPGRTNTDMLTKIYNEGGNSMDPATYDTFKRGRDEGTIHPPETPAKSIVALALHARGNQWSGRSVLWSDEEVQQLI